MIRPGGVRPPTALMARLLGAHRVAHGVEPSCAVLPIAPLSCFEAKARKNVEYTTLERVACNKSSRLMQPPVDVPSA